VEALRWDGNGPWYNISFAKCGFGIVWDAVSGGGRGTASGHYGPSLDSG